MRAFEQLQSTFLLSQEEHLKFEQFVVSLEESNNPLFENLYFKNPLSKFQVLSKLSLSVQLKKFFSHFQTIGEFRRKIFKREKNGH